MTFEIIYDKQPLRFFKKLRLNKDITKRILDKLEETLKGNPVPHDAKAIVGKHGVFRIRIGDYRALYRINYEENKIIIVEADKRSKVYQKQI